MSNKRIACWMSDKKLQKINWNEFEKSCSRHGFEIFKLDLNQAIESQGRFCVLLHKLTDIIASANQGDQKCTSIIEKVENYLVANPSVVVIDPIPNVRQLLNRYISYSKINSTNLSTSGIFTPNFCEITSTDPIRIQEQLANANVTYPFICKPFLGHGSREAHNMAIIFNENSLIDCKPPCVAQSFINHNARLYKIFIVGDKHRYVARPSLKNFHAGNEETIYFDSSDVSKAGSTSSLSILDPQDIEEELAGPDPDVIAKIANTLRLEFGMDLLGVDVVIENTTGKYAIIDVNAYPGYDGFPNFFDALLNCITNKLNMKHSSSNIEYNSVAVNNIPNTISD